MVAKEQLKLNEEVDIDSPIKQDKQEANRAQANENEEQNVVYDEEIDAESIKFDMDDSENASNDE